MLFFMGKGFSADTSYYLACQLQLFKTSEPLGPNASTPLLDLSHYQYCLRQSMLYQDHPSCMSDLQDKPRVARERLDSIDEDSTLFPHKCFGESDGFGSRKLQLQRNYESSIITYHGQFCKDSKRRTRTVEENIAPC